MGDLKKVGIVGLGVIGQRLISEFKKSSHIEIAGVCDSNETLAEKTAIECGGIAHFTSYEELMQKKEIDFIYVAVPPAIHFKIVMAAFSHNKHVLCEKPLANSEQEAILMLQEAERKELIHAMHFPLAYQQAFAFMKKLVAEKTLGEIRRIHLKMHFPQWPRAWQQTNWIGSREQGGFIREITPHYLHIIQRLFGSIKKVESAVEFPVDPKSSELGVIATLELENGIKILVDGLVGQAEKEHIAFVIHGTKQSVSLEDWRIVKVAQQEEEWVRMDLANIVLPRYDLVEELVKKLNGKDAYIINFQEGLEVQKVLEKIITS
ncbi:Gfo/Idh/MocA family protein [Sutcliffiella halmapala]|uniref:Gfo/Idh/MocA family protein n=1 Tax=Sutcliffiella halmapala TaxID=79882 RepID=UPI000994A040|nr:Gfo/Idh/MocA family oxidoreductase [Sutcliffiella halmapala]